MRCDACDELAKDHDRPGWCESCKRYQRPPDGVWLDGWVSSHLVCPECRRVPWCTRSGLAASYNGQADWLRKTFGR
jgi:hypothetical protein